MTKKGLEVELIAPDLSRIEAVLKYINELAEEDTFLGLSPEHPFSLEEEKAFVKNQLNGIAAGKNIVYWAINNNEIIGNVDILRGQNFRDWHVGSVGLSVAQNFRGQGIGEYLLGFILERAKEAGIKIAYLKVFSDNQKAINLYEKFGFKECGRIKKGLFRKNNYSDEVLMSLDLGGFDDQ